MPLKTGEVSKMSLALQAIKALMQVRSCGPDIISKSEILDWIRTNISGQQGVKLSDSLVVKAKRELRGGPKPYDARAFKRASDAPMHNKAEAANVNVSAPSTTSDTPASTVTATPTATSGAAEAKANNADTGTATEGPVLPANNGIDLSVSGRQIFPKNPPHPNASLNERQPQTTVAVFKDIGGFMNESVRLALDLSNRLGSTEAAIDFLTCLKGFESLRR